MTATTRSDKLDIRISPEAKRMLQEAARARHTSISQFVLESALTRRKRCWRIAPT